MTEKKQRIPKNAESIFAGALKLQLEEKVKLCRLLKDDIQKVVQAAEDVAAKAKEIVNGG